MLTKSASIADIFKEQYLSKIRVWENSGGTDGTGRNGSGANGNRKCANHSPNGCQADLPHISMHQASLQKVSFAKQPKELKKIRKSRQKKEEKKHHDIPLHSYLFVSRPKLARRRLLEALGALPCRVSGGIWQLRRRCPTETGQNNPRIRPDETIAQIDWPPVLVNSSREVFSIGCSAALRSAERDQQ